MRHVRRLTSYVESLGYDTLTQRFALHRARWGALDHDEVERLSAGVDEAALDEAPGLVGAAVEQP